jgi:hypothetical protein
VPAGRSHLPDGQARAAFDYTASLMSKKTTKRKLRKKKKANHGKKPNCGRG